MGTPKVIPDIQEDPLIFSRHLHFLESPLHVLKKLTNFPFTEALGLQKYGGEDPESSHVFPLPGTQLSLLVTSGITMVPYSPSFQYGDPVSCSCSASPSLLSEPVFTTQLM